MQKVSVYVRNHSTRRYEKAKPKATYLMGTIYVLRRGSTWETLTNCSGLADATVAAKRKEIELFTGTIEHPRPKPKPKDERALDVLIDIYLTTGKAAEKNWRKHTVQCYA
jgi:hypothetical protein